MVLLEFRWHRSDRYAAPDPRDFVPGAITCFRSSYIQADHSGVYVHASLHDTWIHTWGGQSTFIHTTTIRGGRCFNVPAMSEFDDDDVLSDSEGMEDADEDGGSAKVRTAGGGAMPAVAGTHTPATEAERFTLAEDEPSIAEGNGSEALMALEVGSAVLPWPPPVCMHACMHGTPPCMLSTCGDCTGTTFMHTS